MNLKKAETKLKEFQTSNSSEKISQRLSAGRGLATLSQKIFCRPYDKKKN